ncbi:MAG TPA: ATP-grasp domain-containing protein [Gemmatales bacterium]|nr:ATP-grasp domain-containing protein [Gemmatales bacterium]
MRLFLYEYATAQPTSVPLPVSVRREGRAMFEAVVEDAGKLEPDIEVLTLPLTQDSALSTQDFFGQSDYALIIAPEFDGILERLAREAHKAGCKLLGPLPEAVRLTADKWELYQHWKRLRVPTPETWLPPQLPTEAERYVKKHRYGAGSLGLGWWQLGEELGDQHLVQRYVPGVPVSVALLISPSGKIILLLPAYQLISDDGKFSYQGGSFITEQQLRMRVLELAVTAVKGIPGLQGYVGIDAMLGSKENGSEDVVLEINPRLTTSYLGLRQTTTTNLLKCMIEVVTCDTVVPISWIPAGIMWTS